MKFIRSIIFTPFTFFFVPQSKNASPGLWLTFLTRHTGLLYYTDSCVSTILLMFSQCFLQCFRKYFFLNHPLLISTFSLFLYNFSDNPLKYLKMWFFLNHFDYNQSYNTDTSISHFLKLSPKFSYIFINNTSWSSTFMLYYCRYSIPIIVSPCAGAVGPAALRSFTSKICRIFSGVFSPIPT